MKEKMKGVFIPFEFYELGLSDKEMMILAIYKYYTEEGELKCSVYTNKKIADMIKANVKTVIRAKKRFKALGYIRTDGGIRTYYLGINKGHDVRGGMDTESVGVWTRCPGGYGHDVRGGMDTEYTVDMDTEYTHNKEEKIIKKENNKEIMKSESKEKQTIFDRMIPFMDKEAKEHIDYIRENYKEQIDIINQVEELVEEDDITESYLREQFRLFKNNILLQDDNIYNKKVVPKEEKEDKEIDFDI